MCRGRWTGEQLGCCGRHIVWSRRGRLRSMWHCQCSPCGRGRGRGCLVYVRHQPVERRLAHGSRVLAPDRRRKCTAASFGRSDRPLFPSPPWPSTFQQQFMPAPWAPLVVAVACASSPLRSCWSVHALANCFPRKPRSTITIIIVLSHGFTFAFSFTPLPD